MKHILITCLLMATFEQPIGHTMEGFVMRHNVLWCVEADGKPSKMPLKITREVVDGSTGKVLGDSRPDVRLYSVPEPPAPAPAPEDH